MGRRRIGRTEFTFSNGGLNILNKLNSSHKRMKWIQPVRLLEVDVLENFAYKWLGYSTPENKQEWRPTKIYLMHERICFGNQA